MVRLFSAILIAALFSSGPATACGPQVRIQFSEDSPDRFQIVFVRGPRLELVSLRIDLGPSAGGAFFDSHDGLESQQPSRSGVVIRSVDYDRGGSTAVTLTFGGFAESRSVAFWSDLDDRGMSGDLDQNHIIDGELEGATARATVIAEDGRRIEIDGRFDKKSLAELGERACV